jgi:Flp pilus assembly protein TadG
MGTLTDNQQKSGDSSPQPRQGTVPFWRPAQARRRGSRRGAVAVEAAVMMVILLMLMLGVWEIGRYIELSRTVEDAAREGARLAAGGVSNGTPVTCAMVQTAVQNYLVAAGFPSASANSAQVTLTNLSSDTWTDPCNASPLDPFSVSVTVSGTAFTGMTWVPSQLTGVSQLSASVEWYSNNDSQVVVSTQLPY